MKATIQLGQDSASKLEENGYVKVVCRLCGEPWLFPPKMAEGFDADHGFECNYCRKKHKKPDFTNHTGDNYEN